MKKILFLLLFPTLVFSQDGAFRYFISFANKTNTEYSIDIPAQYLSVRTIAKRQKYGISIDSTDLPVSSIYIDHLKSEGFIVENKSRWFNGVVVSTFDSLLIQTLDQHFIDIVISFGSWQNTKKIGEKWQLNYNVSDYGNSYNQLQMLGGDVMHSKGFLGNGIIIAVIDAGFYKVNELNVFADLNKMMLDTYVFLDGNTIFYYD